MSTAMSIQLAKNPEPWAGFTSGPWQDTVDVRDFIQHNLTPFTGDGDFLADELDVDRCVHGAEAATKWPENKS